MAGLCGRPNGARCASSPRLPARRRPCSRCRARLERASPRRGAVASRPPRRPATGCCAPSRRLARPTCPSPGCPTCAPAGPVLVAVDDVQWLDDASMDALAFAFRRIADGPLALLMAARTAASADPLTAGEPPPPLGWQALLSAGPVAEVIDLAPLDMWQIQNLLPDTVPAARARLVARQSRGNPFWAKEILASLDSGAATVPRLALTLTGRL